MGCLYFQDGLKLNARYSACFEEWQWCCLGEIDAKRKKTREASVGLSSETGNLFCPLRPQTAYDLMH